MVGTNFVHRKTFCNFLCVVIDETKIIAPSALSSRTIGSEVTAIQYSKFGRFYMYTCYFVRNASRDQTTPMTVVQRKNPPR